MPHFTRCRTWPASSSCVPEDDWSIACDGIVVGRVRLEWQRTNRTDQYWRWYTGLTDCARGGEDSLAAALAALKAAVLANIKAHGGVRLAGQAYT
jgi:hypothetical protein